MEKLEYAREKDWEAVCRFYEAVCAFQETQAYGPVWHYGFYPAPAELLSHIINGELLLLRRGEEIAAAMVVLGHEDEMYREIPWTIRREPLWVLHLFAVHEAFRGQGIGRKALKLLADLAADAGVNAIHLDVVKGNLPAEKLYRETGYRRVDEQDVYYEDTGDLRVALYELPLDS